MASGRQFQSAIVCGKNEILKTSLFAYGMRNLNWWLPLVRLSECWIKYFLVFISIRPWVSLYISVTLDCLLLVSSVAHPTSFIMSVKLVKTVLFYIEPFPEHWYLSLTTGPKPHLHIPASVVLGMYMQFFYILWTIPKGALYCTQRFVCFSCCHGKWAVHLCLLLMVTLRYGKLSTCSNSTPQKTYFLRGGLFLCEMVTILHLEGLNSICLA